MFAFVLAASVVAGVPQARPPLEFGSDVRMIRLDVSVVDGKGRPILGLGASDFQVFEDGRRVEVALFEAVEDGAPRYVGEPGAAVGPTDTAGYVARDATPMDDGGLVVEPVPRLDRRILLLVDTGAMSRAQLQRARDGASRFVREAAGDGDWVRLVNLSTGQAWDGTVPDDRAALASVARRLLPGGSPWSGTNLADAFPPTSDSRGGRASGITQTTEGRAGAATETATSGQFLSIFAQTAGLLGTLEALLLELDGVEGRKAVVLVSPGFPQLLGLDERLQKVASLARLASATVYFVDAAGLDGLLPEPGGRMVPAFEAAWNRSGGAMDLALATGGFTSRFSNSLLPALARVGSEMRSYYVVGYVPPRPDDGRFRSVQVKVAASGATARTKKGYLAGRRR
jgi:VWFA-related protein